MANTAAIVILSVALFEALLVVIGNVFTISVFWKHCHKLKRTFFPLINLVVADLFAGFTEMIWIGQSGLPVYVHQANRTRKGHISIVFQATFSFASVFFLVLISLERVFALIWPLRHRVASNQCYVCGIGFVWVAAIFTGGMTLLGFYNMLDLKTWVVANSIITILALLIICASYMTIRTRLNNRDPAIDTVRNRQNASEQNMKLSRTLFIVIAASFVCWLPGTVAYPLGYLCVKCVPALIRYIITLIHVANYFVNPIIYYSRTPMFRETFKKLITLRNKSKQYRVQYRP